MLRPNKYKRNIPNPPPNTKYFAYILLGKYNIVNLICKFIFIKLFSCLFSKLNYLCAVIIKQ